MSYAMFKQRLLLSVSAVSFGWRLYWNLFWLPIACPSQEYCIFTLHFFV